MNIGALDLEELAISGEGTVNKKCATLRLSLNVLVDFPEKERENHPRKRETFSLLKLRQRF